jgi:hypothetical protein
MALARQPAAHEEMLDFQVFAALDRVGPSIMPTSGAAVEIDTHWLGGRRHWGGQWEIADIVVVIALRQRGRLVWRKVALLQSKRLYPREIAVVELEWADYGIGIGRLVDRSEDQPPRTQQRAFSFTSDCVYGAMRSGDRQVQSIEKYMQERRITVYYSFYNPPKVPYRGAVPRPASLPLSREDIPLGCRVLKAVDAHRALAHLPVSRTPQFAEMAVLGSSSIDDYAPHGWRLETFIADEVLRCREGRLFERTDDEDLYALLYLREAPIASMIVISIDLPGE